MNKAENFFKHASRDSEETYTFRPHQTEILLYEAVYIYQRLTGEITPLIHIYRAWFMMHNLDIFDEMTKAKMNKIQSLRYKPSERAKYFSDMLPSVHKTTHE